MTISLPGSVRLRPHARDGFIDVGASASAAAAFAPTSLSGLLFWYDATQLTGKVDGDSMVSWPDASGNANDLASFSASWRPTYKTAVQNGRPVVRFDGVDDRLGGSTAVSLKHLFIVLKYALATFSTYAGPFSDTINSGATILIGDNGTTKFYDAGVGTVSFYRDGTLHVSSDQVAPMQTFGVVGLSNSTAWSLTPQLGMDRINAARMWNGDIAEVIGYDTVLSTTNRQAVESYLRAKWGTP